MSTIRTLIISKQGPLPLSTFNVSIVYRLVITLHLDVEDRGEVGNKRDGVMRPRDQKERNKLRLRS